MAFYHMKCCFRSTTIYSFTVSSRSPLIFFFNCRPLYVKPVHLHLSCFAPLWVPFWCASLNIRIQQHRMRPIGQRHANSWSYHSQSQDLECGIFCTGKTVHLYALVWKKCVQTFIQKCSALEKWLNLEVSLFIITVLIFKQLLRIAESGIIQRFKK